MGGKQQGRQLSRQLLLLGQGQRPWGVSGVEGHPPVCKAGTLGQGRPLSSRPVKNCEQSGGSYD